MKLSINVPGTLLGIWLVWLSLTTEGISTLFGLFTLITGVAWLIVSLGIIGRLRR